MRYRLMATYRGSPFEAGIGPGEGDVVLFAACPPPEELGFEPATGHWRKQLRITEVEAVWESRPVGIFRGHRCVVLDDLGDRLHIGYLGHSGYQAEQLGYWQVDRGVFELVAPRADVADVIEERSQLAAPAVPAQPLDYPLAVDEATGVALPIAAEPPLPLEAEALRAASAARRAGPEATAEPAWLAEPPATAEPAWLAEPPATAEPALPADGSQQRRSARRRLATERLFADLAALAGIPVDAYAVGDEVDGALCLLQTDRGYEVFQSAGGARHELQLFGTEEAACFYLFGVLAAAAVRNGSLQPGAGRLRSVRSGGLPHLRRHR